MKGSSGHVGTSDFVVTSGHVGTSCFVVKSGHVELLVIVYPITVYNPNGLICQICLKFFEELRSKWVLFLGGARHWSEVILLMIFGRAPKIYVR